MAHKNTFGRHKEFNIDTIALRCVNRSVHESSQINHLRYITVALLSHCLFCPALFPYVIFCTFIPRKIIKYILKRLYTMQKPPWYIITRDFTPCNWLAWYVSTFMICSLWWLYTMLFSVISFLISYKLLVRHTSNFILIFCLENIYLYVIDWIYY